MGQMGEVVALMEGMELNPPLSPLPTKTSIKGKHNRVIFLDPRRVKPMPVNPRHRTNPGFRPKSIEDLALAIRAVGQLDPAKVCLIDHPEYDAQLYDGERRLRACRLADVMLKVIVNERDLDDALLRAYSVASNFNREGHTCLEIAFAIRDFRKDGHTIEQVAKIFGRSTSFVIQHSHLLRLTPETQAMLTPAEAVTDEEEEGKAPLSLQLALLLVDLNAEDELRLARLIVKNRMGFAEARRFILAFRMKTGQEKEPRRGKTADPFATLASLAKSSESKFGVYVDMPPKKLKEFAEKRSVRERRALADDLYMLGDWASALAAIVDAGPPRVKAKK